MKKSPKDLFSDTVKSAFLPLGKMFYDQGDRTQILYCLYSCFVAGVPTPPWLEEAFTDAYRGVFQFKIKSWDDVFGRPLNKSTRPARERRNRRIANDIYERVEERHKELTDKGRKRPIDKSLFEAVGKEFGVGGTVTSELYYEVKEVDEWIRETMERRIGGSPEHDRIRNLRRCCSPTTQTSKKSFLKKPGNFRVN